MNELVNDLYQQARLDAGHEKGFEATVQDVYQRFAQLIVQECATKMALEIMDKQWVDDAVKNTYKHFGVEE
jgi:Leu/Phe-tRNA-protein transferase